MNRMEFNKQKYEVLHQDRKNVRLKYRMEETWRGNREYKRDFGDHTLNMNRCAIQL